MVEMTVQIPDKLAARNGALGAWFSTHIELGLSSFRPKTVLIANEFWAFLEANPSADNVLAFRIFRINDAARGEERSNC